jgi:hypothetical protein
VYTITIDNGFSTTILILSSRLYEYKSELSMQMEMEHREQIRR